MLLSKSLGFTKKIHHDLLEKNLQRKADSEEPKKKKLLPLKCSGKTKPAALFLNKGEAVEVTTSISVEFHTTDPTQKLLFFSKLKCQVSGSILHIHNLQMQSQGIAECKMPPDTNSEPANAVQISQWFANQQGFMNHFRSPPIFLKYCVCIYTTKGKWNQHDTSISLFDVCSTLMSRFLP